MKKVLETATTTKAKADVEGATTSKAAKKGDVEAATTSKAAKPQAKGKAAKLVQTFDGIEDEADLASALAERASKIKRVANKLGAAGVIETYEQSDRLQSLGNSLSESDKALLLNQDLDLGDEMKKVLETATTTKAKADVEGATTSKAAKKGDVEAATTSKA